jgi:hypothetical protein
MPHRLKEDDDEIEEVDLRGGWNLLLDESPPPVVVNGLEQVDLNFYKLYISDRALTVLSFSFFILSYLSVIVSSKSNVS